MTTLTDDQISALINSRGTDLPEQLPGFDLDTLQRLRAAVAGKEDTPARAAALAAIDTAIGVAETELANAQAALNGSQAAAATDKGADLLDGGAMPDLGGLDLAALEGLQTSEINGKSRGDVLDAIDAAIEALKDKAEHAPEIDASTTKSKTVETPTARRAAFGGPTTVKFADENGEIAHISAVELEPSMFSLGNGKAVLNRKIELGSTLDPARIVHVGLFDEDGDLAGSCEIPGGIVAGGGRVVEFPAGTLAF